MDIKETYDFIAEDWHKDHQSDDWWQEGTDEFAKLLPTGGAVLDVGCGSGVKSQYLLDKGLRVTGTDISEGMIVIAKREVPEAEFFVSDMRDLDTHAEKYDGILAQASLLHIPKNEAGEVVKKLASLLNPGGVLYIAVKSKREGGVDEEVKEENDYGYSYKRFFSYFTVSEIEGYMKDAGLNIITSASNPSGNTDWIQVIGQKPIKLA